MEYTSVIRFVISAYLVFISVAGQKTDVCNDFTGDDKRKCTECKAIKKDTTQRDACFDGLRSKLDYQNLAKDGVDNDTDTLEIYKGIFKDFDATPCIASCDPAGKKPDKQKRLCTEETLKCADDPCDESNLSTCVKKPPPDSRKKRQSSNFNEQYWFRCDFPVTSCCRTCRRTIPMMRPLCIEFRFRERRGKIRRRCVKYAYPVFCPRKNGFQLIDHVSCLRQNCRARCRKEKTFYSFLVTLTPYDGWKGHCPDTTKPVWLVVWFKTIEVDSHCTCPKEGKNG